MTYTYKKTISIETKDEQPLLGQDVHAVAEVRLEALLSYALHQALDDGRPEQTITVADRVFNVTIQHTIRHLNDTV